MSLTEPQAITIAEYNKLKKSSESRLEYIDGIVYMAPSPSTKHQRISSRLHAKLFNFLEGKECEVFPAPFDIELRTVNEDQADESEKTKLVIPDLSVVCDKTKLGENKYSGAPELIIEIISLANQAHDLVKKLNLYMQCGVKEYWIVNPLLNTVQIYVLNEEGQYRQAEILKEIGIAHSEALQGFSINLEELFK